ncbi:MAG: coproporphyrinogen III oxidase family protein [Spirochaetales bacterium]|nr:coproporphyrinogen III oxidase family protein [Spirochaetales bacterium]
MDLEFPYHPEIALYIHIPFCTSRCRYCNFYFETGWSPRVMERTLDGIVHEARSYVENGLLDATSLRTIYLGGGTPSTIPPALFDRFLTNLFQVLSGPRSLEEFCIEVNPESVTTELLEVLSSHDVDRISLGIQTFDTDFLHLLGRRATGSIIDTSLETLATHWPGELNLDFITGIPGQTPTQVIKDLRRALTWNPQHFSLYSLTVEEKTPLEQLTRLGPTHGGVNPVSQGMYEDDWLTGRDFLKSRGYDHYEISNFARPGMESAHNRRYWNLRPYLGLGPGAVSTLWTHQGPVRLTNPSIFAYSPPSKPWNSYQRTIENPSPREWLSDLLLTSTRTREGIGQSIVDSDLARVSGLDPWSLITLAIQETLDPGWTQSAPDFWALEDDSRMIQDNYLVSLELAIDKIVQRTNTELAYQRLTGGESDRKLKSIR